MCDRCISISFASEIEYTQISKHSSTDTYSFTNNDKKRRNAKEKKTSQIEKE